MGFICNRVLASSGQKEVQVRHSAIEATAIQTPPQGPLSYLPCTTLPGRKDISAMGLLFYDVTVCKWTNHSHALHSELLWNTHRSIIYRRGASQKRVRWGTPNESPLVQRPELTLFSSIPVPIIPPPARTDSLTRPMVECGLWRWLSSSIVKPFLGLSNFCFRKNVTRVQKPGDHPLKTQTLGKVVSACENYDNVRL